MPADGIAIAFCEPEQRRDWRQIETLIKRRVSVIDPVTGHAGPPPGSAREPRPAGQRPQQSRYRSPARRARLVRAPVTAMAAMAAMAVGLPAAPDRHPLNRIAAIGDTDPAPGGLQPVTSRRVMARREVDMRGSPRSIWLSVFNRTAGWWAGKIAAAMKRQTAAMAKAPVAKRKRKPPEAALIPPPGAGVAARRIARTTLPASIQAPGRPIAGQRLKRAASSEPRVASPAL